MGWVTETAALRVESMFEELKRQVTDDVEERNGIDVPPRSSVFRFATDADREFVVHAIDPRIGLYGAIEFSLKDKEIVVHGETRREGRQHLFSVKPSSVQEGRRLEVVEGPEKGAVLDIAGTSRKALYGLFFQAQDL